MALDYPYQKAIDPLTELKKWDLRAAQFYDMRRLVKTHDASWSNGSGSSIPDSSLDHVYAAKHLKFTMFPRPDGTKAEVDVRQDESYDRDGKRQVDQRVLGSQSAVSGSAGGLDADSFGN